MNEFLKFFDEKVKTYPMHLEIYYSKIMDLGHGCWYSCKLKHACEDNLSKLFLKWLQSEAE